VRELQFTASHSIPRHEQPAATPLVSAVQCVACGRLLDLNRLSLMVSNHSIEKRPAQFHLGQKRRDRHFVGVNISCELNNDLRMRLTVAKKYRAPEHVFVPTVATSALPPSSIVFISDHAPLHGKYTSSIVPSCL
jgi:hypothetical protein